MLTCGHSQIVPCYRPEEDEWCNTPCGKRLQCGHACKGTCGGCNNSVLHMKCSSEIHEETSTSLIETDIDIECVHLLRAKIFDKCEAIKHLIRSKFPFADIISHRNVNNLQKFLCSRTPDLNILLQQLVYLEDVWKLRTEISEWENSRNTKTADHSLADVEVFLINEILSKQQLKYVSNEISRLQHMKITNKV